MRFTALVCLTLTGCYTYQAIPISTLPELTTAPGRPPESRLQGEGCGGCTVVVDATSPLVLTTRDGATHRVTPYYFQLSETQLVAPDYSLLIEREEIALAEVRTLSTGWTVALILGVAAVAAGTFAAVELTAGEEDLRAR